jgi:hypothetical protein
MRIGPVLKAGTLKSTQKAQNSQKIMKKIPHKIIQTRLGVCPYKIRNSL